MKRLIMTVLVGLLIGLYSCQRNEFVEPDYNSNYTENYMIVATADPTTVRIYSGKRDTTQLVIELTDQAGNPVRGEEILLYILNYKGVQRLMGYFAGSSSSAVIFKTNSEGQIRTTYYCPNTSEYNKAYFYIRMELISTGQHAAVPIYQMVPINCIY